MVEQVNSIFRFLVDLTLGFSVQDCMPDVLYSEITDESKVNQLVVNEMESLGFQRAEVIEAVLKNSFDDAVGLSSVL